MKKIRWPLLTLFGLLVLAGNAIQPTQATSGKVTLVRTPNGGIQPQAVMDERGTLHLIYLTGESGASDVFYVRRAPGKDFSAPLRVNSQPGSAIATGTIRGAQLSIGKNGRVYVAWNGSGKAERSPQNSEPMLYTRLNDAGTAFEPQRNLMQITRGLDGGGSLAADTFGNVYVVWHAVGEQKGEEHRRIWLARSTDEGKTFAREVAVDPLDGNNKGTGACGCCGMRAFADDQGKLYLLYRTATQMTERGMFMLVSGDKGKSFTGERLDNWQLTTCPMSSVTMASMSGQGKPTLGAWENNGQVFFTALTPKASTPVAAPDATSKRKHPAIATNTRGDTVLVWTEGTGWKKGGALAWQVYDRNGKPTAEKGSAPDVPVWGLATVVAETDGSFSIFY